jgi:hypothetical protein
MAEADELQHQLLVAQNADGGWPFRTGSSWTEPTALALLALESRDELGKARDRALSWLVGRQRADGGWAPNDTVQTSTWVTSLAVLALARAHEHAVRAQRAVGWVAGQMYPDVSAFQQFLSRVLGIGPPKMPGSSPWFPGTAGWVAPTAMSILALSQAAYLTNHQELVALVKHGQAYLLSRRCCDGGWNHGGSKFRSENATSYPEMTGLALLALEGVPALELAPALRLGDAFLRHPDSPEALSWLQMGLLAHGRTVEVRKVCMPIRTIRDTSLRLLALAAGNGKNRLLKGLA